MSPTHFGPAQGKHIRHTTRSCLFVRYHRVANTVMEEVSSVTSLTQQEIVVITKRKPRVMQCQISACAREMGRQVPFSLNNHSGRPTTMMTTTTTTTTTRKNRGLKNLRWHTLMWSFSTTFTCLCCWTVDNPRNLLLATDIANMAPHPPDTSWTCTWSVENEVFSRWAICCSDSSAEELLADNNRRKMRNRAVIKRGRQQNPRKQVSVERLATFRSSRLVAPFAESVRGREACATAAPAC